MQNKMQKEQAKANLELGREADQVSTSSPYTQSQASEAVREVRRGVVWTSEVKRGVVGISEVKRGVVDSHQRQRPCERSQKEAGAGQRQRPGPQRQRCGRGRTSLRSEAMPQHEPKLR